MILSQEIRAFLTSRRARISPEQAGIVGHGEVRRVTGLRREEVAALAGMSIDYYKRLERGNLRGVSDAVLEALANALQLDAAEQAHLSNLARAANQTMRSRARAVSHPAPDDALAELVDHVGVPALLLNGRLDILGANPMGRALFSIYFDSSADPPNIARQSFLDPRLRSFWVDWESIARNNAAILRTQLGVQPQDVALNALIGDLLTGSEDFRRVWSLHEVVLHRSGEKAVRHPVVGEMEFTYQTLQVDTDAGPLGIGTFTVAPGSPSEAALKLLTPARI